MSKWNDRKKKDDEQNAQIKKPEESAVKDYSAGAIGKAYANTERPAMKTAQTPSFDEPSLTGVYGLQKNSKGESVMDMTGKTSGSLQGMKLALNNELTISGQTKLKQSLNKQIDSEQETRQKNANARNAAMLELAEMPLMGFDGQSINANTADAATVIRGINAIADDTLRARAAKAFKTLTQTEGSRFYGENADGVGTFLESANLTRDEYRDATEDYASRFYGDGKHDKEDAAAYLKARQEIEESAYSDYAKSQLTAALDKAYTGITGGETPTESAGDEPAEAEDEARATEEEQKKEKKPGFWSGLTGKVPEQEEQEKAENPAQAKAQSRIVSQTMTASTAPGFPTAGKAKTDKSGKAPEVQGPVQMTPEERIVAQGGMSFAEWMAATPSVSSADTSLEEGGRERTDETGAEIRMHEAQTIGEAADALLKGRYDRIEGAGKDELDRMLAESGNARRMIGTLTEADSQRIILGNDMADAVTYGNIAAQGQTVKTLYDVMKSDSFPDELRGDVMAQMVVWAAQAEAMEKAGTLGGDAELPLMERLLTTDEHAMDELASIYAARDELLFDKADMRRAQEEASAQALSDARTAALKGTASEEQLALVRQNAQVGQDELNADMGYVGRLAAVDDYFRPGASKNAASPFDSSSVKLNLDAQGVIDTGDYQAQLREQMDALLEEDTQTALALGLTLDEYYAKTGGVDMNALCERAASRISQQGAAITDEEMAALDVPFGQGVGASYTVGAGIRAGGEQWYLDFKDSLYTGYSQGMVLVNAARIQNRYQNEYGAYGRTQYRKDIESALASGTLDETYAGALRKALAGAADVYQLGIDPMDFEGDFLKNSAEVRRDIATMEGFMRTNATEDEFKWFGRVKSMTYNAVSAGVAAGTTLATGNSLIGFNTGYSVVGFKNNFDEYLQKGYSIDSARYLGAVNTGLDCAVNIGTFEGVLGRMTGMSALTEAARSRIIRNPAGACRGLAAIRTFGEAFSKAFAQNEFDEVVHDEFFEGLSANWTDNALGEIFRKVDAGEDITFTDGLNMALNLLNPKNLDVKGAAEGVVSGAVENAIGAVLFSLSGAAGSGVGTLRGVKAAQDLMNGKRTDVENVILDVTKTLGDEQACALLNDYARQQKESKAVAEEIISGKDERGSAAHAAKAKQQADEARAQAEAAQTAADNSRAQFAEASDAVMNGDLTRQKEMTEARVRMGENQKTANEQGAVAARRTDEMQQAAAQRLAEARQAGRKAVIAEDAAAREAMLDDREARMQAIDNEIAQLDAQQQAAEEEFYAATQSYTEAEAMGMDEETLGQLDARMNEIGARLMALYDRREALQNPEAYEARRKAETETAEREQQAQEEYQRQTEREQTQSEMDEIAPVVRDIRKKRIWLNEQQIAEVLHTTGLRTIAQVNRQYGTQFRVNRKSADVDLDSGFFRELAAQIPGRMDEASAHPETEILNLLDRSGELKGKLSGMEASIGAVGADAGQEGVDQGGIKNPVFQKFSSVIGKHFGTQIVVADLGDGLRGHYDPQTNRLYISSRMGTGEAMRVVLCHELTHFIENGKGYGAYRDAVLQAAYHGDETAMRHDVERITEVYAPVYERDGRTFTPEDAQKELVARATETVIGKLADWTKTGGETQIYDLLGEKQRFGIRLYNSLTQFIARVKAKTAGRMDEYNDLVKARDALRTALMDAGRAAKEGRRQYAMDLGQDSHYDYSKSFAEQVEDWKNGKFPKNDALLVGRTPEVFRRIGLNDLPMTMNQTHVDYAVNGTKEDHQMSLVMLEHLPELLEHPVAIIESATRPNDSIVAIVDGTINGKNVIVPITIQTSSTANGVQIDANHLASAYGKKNAVNLLENALKKENADSVGVYYLDKNRASNLISDPRVQFPSISEKTGLIHSIFDAGGSVKQKSMEQTETRQFKRWFKDSKVVDEDGKPLIVYHGSDADFNAFDMTKGRANMDIQGAFFSPWDDDAAGYGGNVKAFYLSIKNPADEGTAYKALNRFKGQNEAGVKAREYLESLGYDGVNNGGEEYIAFHPEQIKSATDNVGLFDPMNPDTRYSLVLNQFGNVNAQKIDTLTDRIKQGLIGDAHEKQINREQVERANARYDQEGADALIADLASRDMWTADETVAAQVAMLRSQDEGYLVRALRIAQMYDDHRSKAGQALQAGNALKRLTASGAMAEMVRQADDANREKGVDEGNIPVGDSAPVKKQGRIYDTAETVQQKAQSAPNSDVVSADNPLHIPLSGAQTALIDHYGLWGTKLPGYDYFKASVKERQLAAIIATPNNNRGNGLLTLCQQLEFMKRGYAVVTEADLNYITGEMATYQLLEGDNETPQTPEGKTIIQRMYSAQANTKQNSAWQKFNNYGYDSMLSGSKTWNKNVMSNVLIRPLELTSEAIGSVADRMIAKRTGNRTTALSSKEGRQAGKQAFGDEIANTLTDYIIRGVDTGHSISFDMNHNNRTYNNAFMQAVHDFIAMVMQLGDRPFYEQSYQEELDAITRLGTKIQDTRETADGYTETYLRDMTQEERHAEATRRATERVFQEDNAIIDAINRIKRENKGADMVITAIMPFLKTPTNVAIRSMQYSPIGLAYTVVKNGLIDAKINNGVNFDQRKFVMNLGRGLTGTGMMVLGVALANMGLIRKGREDEDDAKLAAIEKSNGRSYGMYFDLGGIQIPLDFAFPAIAPWVIGAEIAESLEQFEGDFGAMAVDMNKRMAASSIDQLFDNSMLSGVSDVFRGYKDGTQIATSILEGVVENTASRLTPSAVRAFAKFTDPYVRDTKSQNYIRQVINQTIIQNWPLLRQTLPTAKTITGEEQLQTGANSWNKESQNAALHFLNSFITPWTAGSETSDALLDELVDIASRKKETGWLPGQLVSGNKYEVSVTKTLAKELKVGKVGFNQYEGFKIRLTDEEKRWANSTYADTLFNGSGRDTIGLRAMMSGNRWERMSDEERIEAVRDMQKTAKKQVLTELVRRKKEAGEIR
nr:MAG TPA: PolyVal ADP-Ribosyltransferase [Caudoviricetes sp.]